MPFTSRSSTRITSNRRARSVLVFSPSPYAVALARLQPGDRLLDLAAPVGAAPGTGQTPLQSKEPLGFLHAQPGRAGICPVEKAAAALTPVHTTTYRYPVPGSARGSRRTLRAAPGAVRVTGRLPVRQVAGAADLDPADLRDQHNRTSGRLSWRPAALGRRRPGTPRADPLAPGRASWVPAKKLRHAWSRSARLLLHRHRTPASHGSTPARRSTAGSARPGPGRTPPPTPHQPLLQPKVPHVRACPHCSSSRTPALVSGTAGTGHVFDSIIGLCRLAGH